MKGVFYWAQESGSKTRAECQAWKTTCTRLLHKHGKPQLSCPGTKKMLQTALQECVTSCAERMSMLEEKLEEEQCSANTSISKWIDGKEEQQAMSIKNHPF